MPQNIIAHELLGNIFFAHELHELTRRLCAKKNGDRVGRTNLHECKEFFIYMSCGVVPFFEIFGCTRHSPNKFGSALACTKIPGTSTLSRLSEDFVPGYHRFALYCLPGRINAIASSRGLRPRLPSLRSVVPSRHSSSPKSINVSIFVTTTGTT